MTGNHFLSIFILLILAKKHEGSVPLLKKGCDKSVIQTRSSLAKVKPSTVHIIPTELLKGIKRSIVDDCYGKKVVVQIAKSAFGTVLQSRNPMKSRSYKTNDTKLNAVKRSKPVSSALSHIIRNENSEKRTVLKTNFKTLKNSPLWSLSKLIDDVSAIAEKKRKNATVESSKIKETADDYNPMSMPERFSHKTGTTKGTVDVSDSKGLKATLAKAIEKVEKVVANKHGELTKNKDAASDAEKLLAVIRKVNKTIEGVRKSTGNKTEDIKTSMNTTLKSSNKTQAITDPYAEIAAGPDRPKIPELRPGDDGPSVSDISTKFSGATADANMMAKDSTPLSGQHDVGGLLDSLTDKLNSGGDGVATEQPLSGNDVKYIQSQLEDEQQQQQQQQQQTEQSQQQQPIPSGGPSVPEQITETEQANALPHPVPQQDVIKDDPVANHISKMVEEQAAAKMEPAQAEDGGLDKEVMDKLAATEEGLSKTINDKANSLSKLGAMDLIKGPGRGNEEITDYSDADISPGPDPYALPSTDAGRNGVAGVPVGTAFGSHEMETSDLLNGGGISNLGVQDGVERSDMSTSEGNFEQAAESSPVGGFEPVGDLTGNTRSSTKSEESYLNEAMGGISEEGGFNTRQHIPDSLWDGPKGFGSFSNSYNAQMFKKNVILRPKKDMYISPFSGKESFEYDV